jgi:glycosyltransferase involved in cell wall biosynthesis
VVSIPAAHPYAQRVASSVDVTVLADPRPAGAPEGQWWPPVALDPEWIRANADAADVLHIHFGTESFTAAHLAECLAAARAIGWPVVFTVHDLEHPQLTEQNDYQAQLDVLVPGADALLTLTDGAAREIQRRWGRTAIVVPHPAVLDEAVAHDAVLDGAVRDGAASPIRIGMHLKDLRSNVDAVGMVTALSAAVDRLSAHGWDVTAEVRMHHRVRNEATRDAVRAIVRDHTHIELIEHDRLDDAGLASAIAGLDVCVLPYQHGTHSGWLEMCWDLGVGVAAPTVGFYAEQHTDGTVAGFELDASATSTDTPESTGSASLAAAIETVLDSPFGTPPGTPARAAELARRRAVRAIDLDALTATHVALYRELLGTRPLDQDLAS